MDIDVKNAYLKIVKMLDADQLQAFNSQIYKFIKKISKNDGEERFEEFRKLYISGNIDKENLLNCDRKYTTTKETIAFFTTLGKSYLFSKFDRNDIKKENVIEYIEELSKPIISQKEIDSCGLMTEATESNKHQYDETKSEKLEPEEIEVEKNDSEDQEPEESLEELMLKLDSMIGLSGVKNEVKQIINLINLQKKTEALGIKQTPLSLHLVFYGNPGTGKTTVARLLSKIYKALGVLSKGQLVEVDRGGLVKGYVGQTAIRTQEVINEAMGGILFIDEAYTLTHGKSEGDFGQEAVDTILKAMEDHRDDFIVIVAGYPDLMKEFVESNPGLKSRFNQYIYFEDYTPEELYEIFRKYCSDSSLVVEDDCQEYLINYFSDLYDRRDENYANGRDVRNYFEKVYRAHANRIAIISEEVTAEQLVTIIPDDLKAAKEMKDSNW